MVEDVSGRLRVEVLGPLRVWSDDREVPLGSNRQQAVFAVLTAHPNQVVSQRTLITGVWGSAVPASATGNLHTYLSGLRRALGPARDALVSGSDGYSLRLDRSALDSEVFERTRLEAERRYAAGDLPGAAALLDEALGLWSGEGYAGLRSPFAEQARRRLASLRLDAIRLRARARLESGEHGGLVAELTDLVRLHPLDESLRELLMLALHRGGRHAEALESFREARVALAREGLAPGQALRDLHQVVLSGPSALPAQGSLLRVQPSAVRLPPRGLVGRAAELEALGCALDDVLAGRGRAVWVEGEAGVGKTALLVTALAGSTGRPHHVAWGTTDELSARFPLQVVLEALDVTSSSADRRRADLAGQLRDPAAQRWWNRTAPVDRLLGLVADLCSTAPLVLVLDGLQWADDASLLFWDRLVGATGHLPLLLVGATRPDRSRAGVGHLRDSVVAGGGVVLEPAPLSAADAERLVGSVVGASSGPALRSLAAIAAGNPLYALEIAELMVRDGCVRVVDGVAEVDETVLSDSVYQLRNGVGKSLAHLSEDTRAVLRSAALLGMRFDVGELAAVTGRLPLHLLRALDEAVAAHLVAESDGLLAFRHPFVRWTLYKGVPQSLRVALHRQAAQALAEAGAPADRVAEHLTVESSVIDAWTTRWLVTHREEVVDRAPLLAVDLLRRVLAATPAGGAERAALWMSLLRALFHLGRDPGAEVAEALVEIADPADAAEARHLLALARRRAGDTAGALAVLEGAVRARGVPAIWRVRHHALLAGLRRSAAADLDEADADAERVRAEAVAAGDACEAAYASRSRWLVATLRRDHAQALRHVEEGLAALDGRPELVEARCDLLDNRAFTLQNLDRLDDAETALLEARTAVSHHGLSARMQVPFAVHHYWTGDWDRALVELSGVNREARGLTFDLVREPGPGTALLRGVSALISLHRDERANAAVHLDAVGAYARMTTAERESADFLLVAWALAAEQRDSLDEAVRVLSPLLRPEEAPLVLRHQWLPYLVRLALDADWGDVAREALEVCEEEAAREVLPARAAAAAAHCRGLLVGDPHVLLGVAGHYRSVGRAVELAAVLEDAAVLLARGSGADGASADTVLAEVDRLYRRFGATWDLRRCRDRVASSGG
ncbi:BTAD domain-containing putative transcriptional regulator [Saccharothrix longispora]